MHVRVESMIEETPRGLQVRGLSDLPPEKYVIIECASETQQVEALRLCKEAGFPCRAVMS